MEIQSIPINKINPAVYNPRLDLRPGDPDYEKLKKSLVEFDLIEPLIWNKRTGNLVGGHQRLKILIEQGKKDVEVSVVDLSDAKEKALNLALNKISGDWDLPKLKDLLQELDTGEFDLDVTGFDVNEIEDLMTQFHEPDEKDDVIPDVPEEPITKLGDLYLLGEHRLLCGDATKINDVEKLMDGGKADMVFTDPPYGMDLDVSNSDNVGFKDNWKSKKKHYSKVIGDDKDYDPSHLFRMFGYVGELFLWGFDYFAEFIPNRKEGSVVVWDKRKGVEEMKLTFSEFELCWSKKRHLREIVRVTWSGLLGTEQEFDHKRHHPTQKPIGLCEWFINKFSNKDNLIIDIFGGSGSTLIACEKLNRKCYMMEIDPHYCDVIVKRWEDYTNKKAEIING